VPNILKLPSVGGFNGAVRRLWVMMDLLSRPRTGHRLKCMQRLIRTALIRTRPGRRRNWEVVEGAEGKPVVAAPGGSRSEVAAVVSSSRSVVAEGKPVVAAVVSSSRSEVVARPAVSLHQC
jgi:hypothetical protein